MTSDVQDLASRAKRSETLEMLARFGYLGSGVVHLLIAWIAVRVAVGGSGDADESGALEQLGSSTGGSVLLWVCVAGFAALALWHLIEAVVPHQGEAKEQLVDRGKPIGKVGVYGALGFTAVRAVLGQGADGGETASAATQTLMSAPAGRLLVGVLGLVVLGIGAYHVFKGVTRRFLEDLSRGGSREVSGTVTVLGIIGYTAKGVALGIVGILFVVAALQADPSQPTGMDAALKSLRDQPMGEMLLLAVAIGLAGYGLYSFARARHAAM